jgi:hypothetical protein
VLLKRIGNTPLRQLIPTLYVAQRYDCIITSENNASLLLYYFLSSRVSPPRSKLGEWPFYLVPLLLGQDRYVHIETPIEYAHPDITEAINKFKSTSDQDELSTELHPQFVQQCFDLSKKMMRIRETAKPELVVGLIEECRTLWGARPAVISAALRIARHSKLPKPKSGHYDLSNPDEAMVSRLRAARSKRADSIWWREQFEKGESASFATRLLTHVAFFAFAPNPLIVEISELVATTLDKFSSEEWSTLTAILVPQIDHYSFTSKPEPTAPNALNSLFIRAEVKSVS